MRNKYVAENSGHQKTQCLLWHHLLCWDLGNQLLSSTDGQASLQGPEILKDPQAHWLEQVNSCIFSWMTAPLSKKLTLISADFMLT